MFHVAVVLEEGDVVGGGFDAQDAAEFVVHFDRSRAHVRADSGSLDAGIEIVAELSAEVAREAPTEKSSDVLGLHGVNGGAADGLVQRGQRVPIAKDNIRGVLDLHDAPVVADAQLLDDGAALSRVSIE